jgi:hypothetical protein
MAGGYGNNRPARKIDSSAKRLKKGFCYIYLVFVLYRVDFCDMITIIQVCVQQDMLFGPGAAAGGTYLRCLIWGDKPICVTAPFSGRLFYGRHTRKEEGVKPWKS